MPVLPSRIATTRSTIYRKLCGGGLSVFRQRARSVAARLGSAKAIGCAFLARLPRVAAIPEQREISFTNNAWRFTAESVATRLGCPNISIINDFAAVARAVPALAPEHVESIGGGQVQHSKPMVAIGPGTGTGVACLAFDSQGGPIVFPGEADTSTLRRSPTSRPRFSAACVRSSAGSRSNACCVARAC